MIKNYLRQVNLRKQHGSCMPQGWGCQARVLITQQVGSCSVGTGSVVLSDWHPSCGTGNAEFPEGNYLMHLSLVSTPKHRHGSRPLRPQRTLRACVHS